MRAFLPAALLLTALGAGAAMPQGTGPPIDFSGNVLFNEFVYRSILELPEDSPATLGTARKVARTIARFLHDAGYQLATVRARVHEGRIRVDVQEGQLDKVIFLGEGAFQTLRLKLEFSLPQNVFNRPLLERQLGQLALRFQLQDFAYELVAVEDKGRPLPQIESTIESLQALPFVQAGRPYELRIFVSPTPWGTGFSPDLYVGGVEGLGIGAHYTGKQLFLGNDRWEAGGRVATAVRQHLDSADSRPVLTRALAAVRYIAPPLIGENLRPSFTVRGDLISYQRGDLHLDSYDQLVLEGSLDARYQIAPQIELSVGLGLERRFLIDVHSVGAPAPQVAAAPIAQTRPYGQTSLGLTFNHDEIRRDRRHALDVDGRVYGASSGGRADTLRLLAHYQKMWTFGWNELWIELRGTLLAGDVLFLDERSIGNDLRGPFGGTDFARHVASLSVEYRYSFLRDVFKVGIYHDAVGFGAIDRTVPSMGPEKLLGANAAGLAAHLLLLDEFQCDAYYGYGWTTDGRNDHGLALVIRQAF